MSKQKPKRQPFSEEEKDYIYEMMLEAKVKGLSLDTVAKDLAEQLDSSYYTIKNVYGKIAHKKKEEALAHLTPTINEVDESEIEEAEYIKKDTQMTLSIGDAIEGYKQSVIDEYKANTPKAPEVVKQVVEINVNELVASQTKALLERIEELIEERNDWKHKAEKVEQENAKLREKFMNHILSN